jgi:transcription antitermination factor NusG
LISVVDDVQRGSLSSSCFPWYAIRTKSNYEKLAATVLQSKGYEQYLPMYRSRRRWSDRTVEADQPLFPGYLFCRFDVTQRLPIVTTPGFVSIVSLGMQPAPIAESEIESVRMVLRRGLSTQPCPFLAEGHRIRVNSGPLRGVEGVLLRAGSQWTVVVSITMLRRSISVEVDREWVSAI